MTTQSKRSLTLVVATLGSLLAFGAHAQEVQPAPSGNEQSVISVDPVSSMGTPGADSPVSQSQEGNRTTIDFDQGEMGNANTPSDLNERNSTIEYNDTPAAAPEGGSFDGDAV